MVLTVPYRFHLHQIHHRNVPHCRNGPNNDNIDHLQGNIPLMQKVKSGFRFQDYELTRLTHEEINTLATSITRNCVVITGTITYMIVLFFRIWKKKKIELEF